MPPVTIPSFTKAGLPATPAAGDLARVTDSVQGVWLADGTAASSWFSVLGETVNVKDFGAKGDGATNDQTAIQNAVNAATGVVWIPPGTYVCQSAITLKPGVTLAGAGNMASILQFNAATQGLVYAPGVLTEAQITIRDLRVSGVVGTTNELIAFTRATMITLNNLNVRGTKLDCIKLDFCSAVSILRCRIENATRKGIRMLNSTNVWTVQGCSFQGNAVAGESAIYIDGSGWGGIRDCDFEGSTVVQHAIQIAGSCIEVANNFMENYSTSVIEFLTTSPSSLLTITRNEIACSSGSPQTFIDGGSTLTHPGIQVIANRFVGPANSTCFAPGAGGSTFEYRLNDHTGTTATDVAGFASIHAQTAILSEGSIGGATPTVANMQYAEVHNSGGPVNMTNMLGGKRDQMITLRFEDNNTTVQNTANLRLAGAASKTFKILDTLTLLNVDGTTWVEVCRSVN